jgi:hypothetical protein
MAKMKFRHALFLLAVTACAAREQRYEIDIVALLERS